MSALDLFRLDGRTAIVTGAVAVWVSTWRKPWRTPVPAW